TDASELDDGDFAPPRPLPVTDHRLAIRAALAAEEERNSDATAQHDVAAHHSHSDDDTYGGEANGDATHVPVEHRELTAERGGEFHGSRFGGGDFGESGGDFGGGDFRAASSGEPTPADNAPRVADNPSVGGGRF